MSFMTKSDKNSAKIINHGPMGFVMFVAFVGALVYFTKDSQHLGDVLLAFIKALVWPGFLVYHGLQALGA